MSVAYQSRNFEADENEVIVMLQFWNSDTRRFRIYIKSETHDIGLFHFND